MALGASQYASRCIRPVHGRQACMGYVPGQGHGKADAYQGEDNARRTPLRDATGGRILKHQNSWLLGYR